MFTKDYTASHLCASILALLAAGFCSGTFANQVLAEETSLERPWHEPKTQTLSDALDLLRKELFPLERKDAYSPEVQANLSNSLLANPRWRITNTELAKALAQVERTRALNAFQVTASTNITASESSQEQGVGDSSVFSKSFGGTLSARKLLTDFGANEARERAADRGVEEALSRGMSSKSELLLTILSGLLTRQQILLQSLWQSAIVHERRDLYSVALQRLENGAGTIYEVSRIQLGLVEAESEHSRLISSLKSIESALGRVGITSNVMLDLAVSPDIPSSRTLLSPGYLATLPATKELESKISRLVQEVTASQKDRLPRLFFDAQSSIRSAVQGQSSDLQKENVLQLTFEYSVFDGGMSQSSVANRLAELESARLERETLQLTIQDEFESLINQITLINVTYQDLLESVQIAMESYVSARELFLLRRGTVEQIQQAEGALQRQVVSLISASFENVRLKNTLRHRAGILIQSVLPHANPSNL